MSEPTSSVTYTTILREIARELGWDRTSANWTANQSADAADLIAAGVRKAYYPPDFQWRFLRISFSLTTVSGKREYDLPDDCASIFDGLTYSENDGCVADITLVSENAIRQRYQNNTISATGFPLEAAMRFHRPTAAQSTRAELVVWPEPDGDYTINGQCMVQPNTITSSMPYPYGGPAFHECLLNAILWQCEMKLGENDGKYAAAFAQSLAAARKVDESCVPEVLGYNGDNSDLPTWTFRDLRPGRVTYSGAP